MVLGTGFLGKVESMSRPRHDVGGRPTDGELEVLRVLWASGPSTAREIHDAFVAAKRPRAINTIHRYLEIMIDKRLVHPDDGPRPRRYSPARSKARTQQELVADLLRRVFNGSPAALVEALTETPLTDLELAGIHNVLATYERRREERRNLPPRPEGPWYG